VKKRKWVHPATRAERSVYSAFCALTTVCEKLHRPVTTAEISGIVGDPVPWLEWCLTAARDSGHTIMNEQGQWWPTAEGWDRVGGYEEKT